MVNFGALAAEIRSGSWGTPANFNGFRVLAALLHGTLVVGGSQTLRRWTEGAICIWQGGHHVCIGPHSSLFGSVRQIKLTIRELLGTRKYSVSYHIVSYSTCMTGLLVRILWCTQTALPNCEQTTILQIILTLPSSTPGISLADSVASFFADKISKLRLSLASNLTTLPRHLNTYFFFYNTSWFLLSHPCFRIRNKIRFSQTAPTSNRILIPSPPSFLKMICNDFLVVKVNCSTSV